MQETSEKYKTILSTRNHWFETSITIGDESYLCDENGNEILFGDESVIVGDSSPEAGFGPESLFDVSANHPFFRDSNPGVGAAVSGTLDVTMVAPFNVLRREKVYAYIRACNDDDTSEWIKQGEFYIDTRSQTESGLGFDILKLHCCDSMLLAEEGYPSDDQHDYPLLDTEMVRFIAGKIGVEVDDRTWDVMTAGYEFPLPASYSMREVLCMIAAAYAGNFVITMDGKLRLVSIV